jgi:Rab GDP dissociation inhibitor
LFLQAFEGQEYDAIIVGTGFKECLLSGLLAVEKKKVLHIDRNSYYGGESASLDMNALMGKFKDGADADEGALNGLRDYNVDLVPKFIMAGEDLLKILIHTGVVDYMEYKPVSDETIPIVCFAITY